MKRAHADGADWLWLMDDDVIAEPEALAELLAAPERLNGGPPPGLLASKVVWRDGGVHPMNAPWPERTRIELAIEGAEQGLMPLRFATFASLLVHRGLVDRHGLPLKHFFIWSDDVEYTSRAVLAGDACYLVPTSVALHKTADPHTASLAPPERFYFHVRNTIFMIRAPGRPLRDRLVRLWIVVSSSAAYFKADPNRARAAAIMRGVRDGLRRLPR
jgi:GT2 family glycosyltransferase